MLVKGSPFAFFSCSRDLRQGDIISPFLFIIMVEYFGRFIQKVANNGSLRGLQPSSSIQTCSHQQFVDDTIILGEASIVESKYIHLIFQRYE